MTQRQTFNIGLILIALGSLVFLGNFGLFNGMPGIVGSLLLASAGALFGRVYLKNHRHIWALIIAFGFFGVAAAAIAGGLAGTYFLGILGAGFAFTYFQHRRHWWAVIPAGILASLALIAGIEENFPRFDNASGPILFLGIAATFAYLYFMPEHNKRWAIYPALAAVVIAILSSSFTGGWLLPLALIGCGAYLLRRNKGLAFSFDPETPTSETSAPEIPIAETTVPETSNSKINDKPEPNEELTSKLEKEVDDEKNPN
jgi:MFS family permease